MPVKYQTTNNIWPTPPLHTASTFRSNTVKKATDNKSGNKTETKSASVISNNTTDLKNKNLKPIKNVANIILINTIIINYTLSLKLVNSIFEAQTDIILEFLV